MTNQLKALCALACALLIFSFYACEERKGEKTASKRPNILFAIMDDATYKHMSAYGCTWVQTPNFDKVARNGILFNNAYTPNAKCAPSRANILTGRNSWQLEAAGNHWAYFPQKFKSVAEVLSEHGYKVGYTGKGWVPGVAKHSDGSKRDLLVKGYQKATLKPPTSEISITDYAENFNTFLEEKGEEPFFFWYGGWEPHRAYEYGSGIAKGNKKLSQINDADIFEFWPKTDAVKTDLLDYAFEIEYFDAQLGKMLKKLEAVGELDNTLIVVTSDNGMPFPRVKGQEYEYSNHLPLAMMWADGIPHKGRTVDDLISFIDLAPTFLEVAGVKTETSNMQPITGKSMANILSSSKAGIVDAGRTQILIGKERHDVGRPNDWGYPIRGIVTDSLLYVHNFKTERWPAGNPETGYLNTDGGATKTEILNTVHQAETFKYWQWSFGKRVKEELYDIKNDPDCLNNLAELPDYVNTVKALKTELFNKLTQQQDPRVLDNGDVFDAYPYADKSGVDFYNRYMNNDKSLKWGWVNDSDFQDFQNMDLKFSNHEHLNHVSNFNISLNKTAQINKDNE